MTPQRGSASHRRQAWRHGLWAETVAAWMLRLKGYRILARRFRSGQGEVDIVARRGAVICFVEVKARSSPVDGEVISARQRRRIERSAEVFMQRHPQLAQLGLRFDAVVVQRRGVPRHQPDAWRLGD